MVHSFEAAAPDSKVSDEYLKYGNDLVHDLNMSTTPLGFCRSHIRGGKMEGVWRREEVAETLLRQVSILIVIEGLA